MVGDARHVHDWRLDLTGERPDLVIPIAPGTDFEALSALRIMLRGDAAANASQELRNLLHCMRGCRYGVVFFGLGITETSMWDGQPHSPIGHINVAALLQLVADLNNFTRFTARRMRIQGDVSGTDNVLCWQTGYPFAVDMSRGYPRFNPGEFAPTNYLLAETPTCACSLARRRSLISRSPQRTICVRFPRSFSTIRAFRLTGCPPCILPPVFMA